MESINKMEDRKIKKVAQTHLPTKYGKFILSVYKDNEEKEHVVMEVGDIQDPVLVRLHSSCVTGDIFGSLKCDCGEQLEESMRMIQKEKSGLILYLNQEGRGIGLTNKIKAYALQEKGYDTVEANKKLGLPIDARDYKIAAEILKDFGVSQVRILSNNPDKDEQLVQYGITVVERVPLEIEPHDENREYLRVKKEKMRHILSYV